MSERKLNIIGLTAKNSGCGFHRVSLPLGFMENVQAHVTNLITEDKVAGWDLLLYNRVSLYDSDWQEAKRLLDVKVILDLDDYWKLPPSHINYHDYERMAARIENNIRNADLVTVTNETLASKVRPINDNVLICPNAIPFGRMQYYEDRRSSDLIRVFWCGGVTHERDLAMLRGPISRLQAYRDKIQMVLGGYTDTDGHSAEIWRRMFSSFTDGGRLPYMKIHGTDPYRYMQMYENADICVIPLEASEWHSCKSNLKILEAASKRVPVIVSNVEPYNQDPEAPVLWVNKQSDWFKHLSYLINNPSAREQMGNQLYEWAKEKYSIESVNRTRRAAFASLCTTPALL